MLTRFSDSQTNQHTLDILSFERGKPEKKLWGKMDEKIAEYGFEP